KDGENRPVVRLRHRRFVYPNAWEPAAAFVDRAGAVGACCLCTLTSEGERGLGDRRAAAQIQPGFEGRFAGTRPTDYPVASGDADNRAVDELHELESARGKRGPVANRAVSDEVHVDGITR